MSDKGKSQESVGMAVVKAIGKEGGYEVLIKQSENLLDAFLDDGVLREIPVIKTVLAVGRTGIAVRDVLLVKKLLRFLHEMENVNAERERFEAEMREDPAKAERIGTHLTVLLDRFEESDKAGLLGRAFQAYLKREIDLDAFLRMARVIDRCMLADLALIIQNDSARLVSERPAVAAEFLSYGLVVPQPGIVGVGSGRYVWTDFARSFANLVLKGATGRGGFGS